MLTRFVVVCSLASLGLYGCVTRTTNCAETPTDPSCADLIDANTNDASSDAGSDGGVDAPMIDAHVPCNGSCTGAASHCLATSTSETCVACLAEGDCTGGTHCETTSHTCVACLMDTQCTTAAAAHCDTTTHTCGPCTMDAECTHLSGGLGVCNAGACVQCTIATETTACGANSCDPATHGCTTTPRASVATCHACVADSECVSAMDRCVPMQFMGAAHGSYCLRQSLAGCVRPYSVSAPARASTSGAAAATYCGVDETVTTCEAVQSLIAGQSCTVASDCGAAGLDDGLCNTVGGTANLCTYACGTAPQCPTGVTCNAGYCGS